ncbi:MAG TPA: glycosyltransferase family 4 protein [Steroidobacteraceae bacterium]|nr:glycosyltransferase family 4 protein [Steroidobacteraceae bacterium]
MKIAQVAPLAEAVPPKLYGGTERVVAYLSDALVELGHEVTLFASGDSETRAKLVPIWPRALRLDPSVQDCFVPMFMQLEILARRAHEFDVVHSHLDYFGFPLLKRLGTSSVTTLHGRLDLPELPKLYEVYNDIPVVSISDAQRAPLPGANYVATVLHGLPIDLLSVGDGSGGYLAFLGRISPEKAPDAAIRIAAGAGMPLRIAAKVDRADAEYYKSTVEPLLSQSHVEFVGEIGEDRKGEFLGGAAGLVFPIAWREPFGLVMIEAMACGTPVIAFDQGSVREVLEHGVTGFIVRSEAEAIEAVQRIRTLDRHRIRQEFERRFTAHHMAEHYIELYRRLREDPAVRSRSALNRRAPVLRLPVEASASRLITCADAADPSAADRARSDSQASLSLRQ